MKHLITLVMLLLGLVSVSVEADEPEPMTDGKIVGISLMTNNVQIEGSQYAYARIQYIDLKNFANSMVIDYQNYQNILVDFVNKSGVYPETSALQIEFQGRGKQVLDEMGKLQGTELEKRYIDAEVELHTRTLKTMDQIFLPNVMNRQLGNLVNNLRGTVQNRLQWALRIQSMYP